MSGESHMDAYVSTLPPTHATGIRSFDGVKVLSHTAWQFDWFFGADDAAFSGHFPHQPILAGVFLIEMSQRAAEFALQSVLRRKHRVTRVDRFRFFNPILPGDPCTLQVEWPKAALETGTEAASLQVKVAFSKHGERVAQGMLSVERRGVADAS